MPIRRQLKAHLVGSRRSAVVAKGMAPKKRCHNSGESERVAQPARRRAGNRAADQAHEQAAVEGRVHPRTEPNHGPRTERRTSFCLAAITEHADGRHRGACADLKTPTGASCRDLSAAADRIRRRSIGGCRRHAPKYTVHPWTEGKARALERDADYSKGGYITASPELGIFERTDMCIDVHMDMCADMCMDMSTCIGMREYGHVYGHIKASRRRTS